jgi:hypothetical protein
MDSIYVPKVEERRTIFILHLHANWSNRCPMWLLYDSLLSMSNFEKTHRLLNKLTTTARVTQQQGVID